MVDTQQVFSKKLTIINKLGLHARAAAKLVSHSSHYLSEVEIKKDAQVVNGKSIMGVMMLAASQGTEIELIIKGDDAKEMLDDLTALIANRFGEEE